MNALIIMLLFTWTKIMLVKKCQPATEIKLLLLLLFIKTPLVVFSIHYLILFLIFLH